MTTSSNHLEGGPLESDAAGFLRTIFVSFPRSGHHFIVNFLLAYFSHGEKKFLTDGRFAYRMCRSVFIGGGLRYCEFYNHCRVVGCTDVRVNFQKNHDFGLKLKASPDFQYLVLYRNPVEAIVSYFANFRSGRSRRTWVRFALRNIRAWKGFVRKWVLEPEPGRRLVVAYEDLIEHPADRLISVARFLNPTHSPDPDLVQVLLQSEYIYKPKSLETFVFYDPAFFARLEDEVAPEMDRLGFTTRFFLKERDRKKIFG